MPTQTGRGVLVTGASRGIGRATAVAFASGGDRVAVHYASNREDAEATLAQLPGHGHTIVQGELGDPQTARRVVTDAIEYLDGVDVLVNNAGTAPTEANRHRVDQASYQRWCDAWRRMLDVNLLGTANASWAVAHDLIDRGRPGAIVNVGSRGAFRGEPDHPAYAASKAAMHALGQSLSISLAPHRISVTSVAPGFIGTERQAAKLDGVEGDALREQSPFGRVGTAQEVADAIVYLASPNAMWSSGTVLDVNGASYLRT